MDNMIIEKTIEYVKEVFQNDFSGHDYYHSLRVYQSAVRIAEIENADLEIVSLAALLHDVDDYKLSPETACNMNNARAFLKTLGLSGVNEDRICNIISQISFKGTDTVIPDTIEGKCVQDADRLDALGAIGIARTFAYGGAHNRVIYIPEIVQNPTMNGAEYCKRQSSSIHHFFEKLFLLEDLMNTKTGKKIAHKRTEIMKSFIEDFFKEWNCNF